MLFKNIWHPSWCSEKLTRASSLFRSWLLLRFSPRPYHLERLDDWILYINFWRRKFGTFCILSNTNNFVTISITIRSIPSQHLATIGINMDHNKSYSFFTTNIFRFTTNGRILLPQRRLNPNYVLFRVNSQALTLSSRLLSRWYQIKSRLSMNSSCQNLLVEHHKRWWSNFLTWYRNEAIPESWNQNLTQVNIWLSRWFKREEHGRCIYIPTNKIRVMRRIRKGNVSPLLENDWKLQLHDKQPTQQHHTQKIQVYQKPRLHKTVEIKILRAHLINQPPGAYPNFFSRNIIIII